MGDQTEPLAKSLGRYQAMVVGGLAFIVVFAVTVMGVMFWQSYRLGQTAERIQNVAVTTHNSLCALDLDHQKRYSAGVIFLQKHPEGIPGIDAKIIQSSLDNEKATLDALARGGLSCP